MHCIRFAYDGAGNRKETRYPGGVVMSENYDFANRLTSIISTGPGGLQKKFVYSYTPDASACGAGSFAGQTELFQTMTYNDTATTKYCYDGRDRLKSAVTSGSQTASFTYTYDNRNNRKT